MADTPSDLPPFPPAPSAPTVAPPPNLSMAEYDPSTPMPVAPSDMGLEEWLKRIWEHRITAWILGVAAFCATVSFLRHSPVPGVAIAVLGAVAAVMSIRTLSSYEKFFWTLMAFGILYAEISAIRVDRAEQTKHALEDRAAQDASFLALNKKQDSEFLATESLTSGFSGLQASLDKQFHNTVPVQTFGKGGKPKASTPPIEAVAPAVQPAPLTPQPGLSGSLTISQSNDVSTRADAPYKIKVVIQTTVDMPTLKLALKCSVPLVEAQGGPGSGTLMMTSQGIANADHSIWFMQYGSAVPSFGPSNPIVVNVWAASPVVCNQARTF